MARGGKRTPKNPAPVSGPGRLARRTDGGPGQPVRSFPAEAYGQRQALASLQKAAPMAAGGNGVVAAGGPPAASGGLPPGIANGILGPTQRPTEPVTAGLPSGPDRQIFPDDPDQLLRAIYQRYPHPDIGRFLQGG